MKIKKYAKNTAGALLVAGLINGLIWEAVTVKKSDFYKEYNEKPYKIERQVFYPEMIPENENKKEIWNAVNEHLSENENSNEIYFENNIYQKLDELNHEAKEFVKGMAPYMESIAENCYKYDVNPFLAQAVAYVESHFRPEAKSRKGAKGIFQINDITAKHLGVNQNHIEENIRGGIKYISEMLEKFDGDMRLALAAYNMGPTRLRKTIRKYGKNWDILEKHLPKETRRYVKKVMDAEKFIEETCNELGIDEVKYLYVADNLSDVLMKYQ